MALVETKGVRTRTEKTGKVKETAPQSLKAHRPGLRTFVEIQTIQRKCSIKTRPVKEKEGPGAEMEQQRN